MLAAQCGSDTDTEADCGQSSRCLCLFQPHHACYDVSLLAASVKIHAYASFE